MSVLTQPYFKIVEEINVNSKVVLRRTFMHLISTSIESHNGDDTTKQQSTVLMQSA
jgi:hypothetical protein